MPAVGGVVVTTGARGPAGATGAAGNFPEASVSVSGRQNGSWVPALPIRANSVSAAEATMTGGIYFTNRIATTNTSGHIDLWQGVYGLVNAGSSTVGLVAAGGNIDFHTTVSGPWALRFYGDSDHRAIWFQTDGWRLQWNYAAGGDFLYYDYNSNPLFGYQAAYTRMVSWGNLQTTQYYQLSGPGRGMIYVNITGVGFKFIWASGYVIARLDNGNVDWWLANACDARLKTDIAPSTHNCLETIRKIRLYQYRWKDHRHRPGYPKAAKPDAPTIPVGFIAQRLGEDFPYGLQDKPRPPRGYKRTWDRLVQNSDPNVMMALICGAIQELDDEITRREQQRAAVLT